jgi:O-antigen/teichoic acid export membrane protein
MVVYVVVQITLAVGGAGAYAVVFGQLASSAVVFTVSAAGARWRPHLMLDRSVIRDERRFGGGTLANTVGTFIVKNADNWVVSRTSSASLLGVYYVAYVLPNILRQRLTWMATDVLMPVFARLVADLERSRRAYREALGLHVFIGFPAMAGISALAPRIVAVCFGPKWTAVAAPLRLLALAALVEFVTQAATTVFIAHGIPGRNAVIKVYALVVLLAGLAITYRHGLVPVAGAVVVASTVGAVVSQVLICRLLKLRIRELAVAIAPVALATAIMVGVIVLGDRVLRSWPDAPALAVLILIGGAGYLASGRLLAPATSTALLREALAIVIPGRRQRDKARS